MKNIYLTGPSASTPSEQQFLNKTESLGKLEKLGYTIDSCYVSMICKGLNDRDKMKQRICSMLESDAVITLENWWQDEFCNMEVEIARKLKIPVYHFTIIPSLKPEQNQ